MLISRKYLAALHEMGTRHTKWSRPIVVAFRFRSSSALRTSPRRKKDLVACAKVLINKLRKKGLEDTLKVFENYIKNNQYIPYTKHLRGLAHHQGLGPARRPLKTYKYVIEFLKGLRGVIEKVEKSESFSYLEVLINQRSRRKGILLKSKGRAYLKDKKQFNLILKVNA